MRMEEWDVVASVGTVVLSKVSVPYLRVLAYTITSPLGRFYLNFKLKEA